MAATPLHVAYPDEATRPRMCGNCVHNDTDHMGFDTHAWCGVEEALHPASHECHLDRYELRVQSPEELEMIAQRTKGHDYMLKLIGDNLTEEELENPLVINKRVVLYPVLTKGNPLATVTEYDAPPSSGVPARKIKKNAKNDNKGAA